MHLSVDELRILGTAIGIGYGYGTKFGVACLKAWQKKRREEKEADQDLQIQLAEARLKEIEEPIEIDGVEIDEDLREIIEERNHWLTAAKRSEQQALLYKQLYEQEKEKREPPEKRGHPGSGGGHKINEFRAFLPSWRRAIFAHFPIKKPKKVKMEEKDEPAGR